MSSRWSTNPIERNGEIVSIRPNTPGDNEILKALGRHTILTVPDIAAVTGRTYGAVIPRVSKLKRKPNQLIKVHDTQLLQPRLYQWCPQAFHLTKAGEGMLLELGYEPKAKPRSHFIHQLTQSQTAASFEIGARLQGLEYRQLDRSPNIPVTFTLKGTKYENHKLTPDGGPIELGNGKQWRYVVFETDCASEPLTSSNRDRQAIETKFAAYLTVLAEGLYETHWRIPNCTILFTTTTKVRLDNMRDLLSSMTADYRNCFRFHLLPTILSGAARPPGGWAVTETGLAPKEN